jgi:hypothetical protein
MLAIVRTRVFAPYNHALKSKPLLTKSMTGLTLAGSGDLIAQTLEKRSDAKKSTFASNRDPLHRLLVFASFGFVWTGPFNHYWLGYLARRFPVDAGRTAFVQKMFMHHLVWNPFVYFPFFFGYNGLLLGMNRTEFEEWVRRDYFTNLMWCYVVWGPTTAIIFKKVPEHLQSVVMAGLSLGWNSFLSWRSNR